VGLGVSWAWWVWARVWAWAWAPREAKGGSRSEARRALIKHNQHQAGPYSSSRSTTRSRKSQQGPRARLSNDAGSLALLAKCRTRPCASRQAGASCCVWRTGRGFTKPNATELPCSRRCRSLRSATLRPVRKPFTETRPSLPAPANPYVTSAAVPRGHVHNAARLPAIYHAPSIPARSMNRHAPQGFPSKVVLWRSSDVRPPVLAPQPERGQHRF